jgi:hypothetical protein
MLGNPLPENCQPLIEILVVHPQTTQIVQSRRTQSQAPETADAQNRGTAAKFLEGVCLRPANQVLPPTKAANFVYDP